MVTLIALVISPAWAAEKYLDQGISEYRQENYEEALESFKKAQAQDPASSVLAFYTGMALKQTGDLKEAEVQFRKALDLSPPVNDAYVELLDVLYTQNKFEEALKWVARAEEAKVKPGQVAFLKGLILVKVQKSAEAREAFEKAKKSDSSLSQNADLQIALSFASEKKFEEAQQSLDLVIKVDPNTEAASFAKEYLKSVQLGKEIFKEWRFSFGASVKYDDNVILKPGEDVPNLLVSNQKDGAVINTFRVDYRPNVSGDWFFNGQYNLYNMVYFKLSDYNMLINALVLAPGYNLTKKSAITIPVTFNYALLKYRSYMFTASLKPTYNLMFVPNNILQATLGYERTAMMNDILDADEDRSGNRYSGNLSYVLAFEKGRGMFNVRYEYSIDDTSGANWANKGNKFGVGLVVPLSDEVSAMATGEAYLQNFDNVHSILDVKRKDKTYNAMLNLVWQVSKPLFVNLQYSHTTADSNIVFYDYRRNIYSTGVEYRF